VTVSTARPVRIDPPPPGWNARRPGTDADRTATTAMVAGILSFVVNPLLIASIIGIVYGRRALRAGTAYRGRAIAGIATGISGIVLIVLAVIVGFLIGFLGAAAAHQGLESGIVRGMAQQGTTLTDVACPSSPSPRTGTTLVCTGQAAGIGPVRIDLAFTSETAYTARVVRAG
jgi:hypothetical protein